MCIRHLYVHGNVHSFANIVTNSPSLSISALLVSGMDDPSLEYCTGLISHYEPTDEGKAQGLMSIDGTCVHCACRIQYTHVHVVGGGTCMSLYACIHT